MQGHDLGNTGEAVARDVVKVVAAQVEETRVGRETPRNFGVTAVLTRGVVCLSLKTDREVLFSELEVSPAGSAFMQVMNKSTSQKSLPSHVMFLCQSKSKSEKAMQLQDIFE